MSGKTSRSETSTSVVFFSRFEVPKKLTWLAEMRRLRFWRFLISLINRPPTWQQKIEKHQNQNTSSPYKSKVTWRYRILRHLEFLNFEKLASFFQIHIALFASCCFWFLRERCWQCKIRKRLMNLILEEDWTTPTVSSSKSSKSSPGAAGRC